MVQLQGTTKKSCLQQNTVYNDRYCTSEQTEETNVHSPELL